MFCWYIADVEVNDLLVNASEFMDELSTNFSIPYETVDSLLNARINLTEVQKETFHCIEAVPSIVVLR